MSLTQSLQEHLSALKTPHAEAFLSAGLPTPKLEKWHYTNLNTLNRMDWAYKTAGHASQQTCDKSDIRFLDGHATVCNVPEGVRVLTAEEASNNAHFKAMQEGVFNAPEESLAALAQAEGSTLYLLVDGTVDTPLTLENLQLMKQAVSHPSLCVVLTEGAKVTLTTHSHSAHECWVNPLTRVYVSKEAELTLIHLQQEHASAVHTSQTFIDAKEGAHVNVYGLNIGGSLGRQSVTVNLNGDDIQTTMAIANLVEGKQTQDFTIEINHNGLGCETSVLSRNVCRDRGQSVFQGKFYVDQQAQKTDAEMHCKSLLLSDRSRADSKPELEIYADDVKCGHGATVGTLDSDALFYLTARGVPHSVAESLLVAGFIDEVLETLPDEATQTLWRGYVDAWLNTSAEV